MQTRVIVFFLLLLIFVTYTISNHVLNVTLLHNKVKIIVHINSPATPATNIQNTR